jgi:hypothetical protein
VLQSNPKNLRDIEKQTKLEKNSNGSIGKDVKQEQIDQFSTLITASSSRTLPE